MNGDLPAQHPANAYLGQLYLARMAGAPAAAAAAHSSGQAALTSTLTPRDKQLNALSALGVTCSFAPHSSPPTAAELLVISRNFINSGHFMPLAESTRTLIRSGRMVEVGWALPILTAAARLEATRATSSVSIVAGAIQTESKVSIAPPIINGSALLNAFTSSIVPSLYDRPHQLLQWNTLIRSVLALEERYDWDTAIAYMHTSLGESTLLGGASIDQINTNALHAVQLNSGRVAPQRIRDPEQKRWRGGRERTAGGRGGGKPAGSAAGKPAGGGDKPSFASARALCAKQGMCSDYNFAVGKCPRAKCQYKHKCPFRPAHNCADDEHRGYDCTHFKK